MFATELLICDSRQKGLLDAVETASAQNGSDDGARRARIAEAHIAAASVPVYRHFGDERDANAGGDHSKETAELTAFECDARRDAGVGAGGDTEVPKAVAVAQHDEGLSAEILEGERPRRGKGMVLGQHGEKWFGAQGKQLQVFVTQREGEDRKIDRQVSQAFE